MIIEVTKVDLDKVLINTDKIITVEENKQGCTIHANGLYSPLVVRESLEDIKKLLGLHITPRAETIMMK